MNTLVDITIITKTYGQKSITNYVTTHTWITALLQKLIVIQLVKKFPAFHGIWSFITMFI